MALSGINQINCGPTGYQNLSIRIKIAQPQTPPEKVTLTLYSIADANYYQYDLTPELSDTSKMGIWNNLTIPVGQGNWQSSGSPQWSNITALKLDFTFPTNSNVTLRIAGLFFRGIYQNLIEYLGNTMFTVQVLQIVFMQFLFEWLIFAAILYIVIKLLKGNITWKPLFVAISFALIVLAIQSLINIAATLTLPTIYSPVEGYIFTEAIAINEAFVAATTTFAVIRLVALIAMYTWVGILGALIVRSLLPEFSRSKSALVSSASLIATIIIAVYFLGISI
jgi:hypothetical protein